MTSAPLDPGRRQGQAWAVEELSRREYVEAQPGAVEQAGRWLAERLAEWLSTASTAGSPGWALAVGVLVVVVAALAGWAWRRYGGPGPLRAARGDDPLFGVGGARSAAEHHGDALRAQAAGDWERALLEAFRALVRRLEERTLLTVRPGRTAHEAAVEAGAALPDVTDRLLAAADAFDEVRYGGRPATPEAVALVLAVDDEADRVIGAGRAMLT